MITVRAESRFVSGRVLATGVIAIEADHGAIGRRAHELASRHGVRIRYATTPTTGCAPATPSTREIVFDPACANQVAVLAGCCAVELILLHEIGHLLTPQLAGSRA